MLSLWRLTIFYLEGLGSMIEMLSLMVSQTNFHLCTKGKKVTITPLFPSEVYEDQIKIRVKKEQERKEEKNL